MKTAVSHSRYQAEKNKVLDDSYRVSSNFYLSDKIFRNYFKSQVSVSGLKYMHDKLDSLGKEAAGKMNELSLLADKFTPELIKRNSLGENINEIRFHPSYGELMKIAVKSEMFRVKWNPELRNKFDDEKQRLGFSAGYIYSMSECGQYCPLCMTDGVARLIDLFCDEEDKNRLLPHIYTDNAGDFFTGAMFLTEKTGGSDVGANISVANHQEEKKYLLNGEKWFCSNANADLIFALARTDSTVKGTKGLSIFLVEKHLPSGERNPIDIIRIKDKLGVRSMATAECILTDSVGKLVGNEFEGFKVMTEMINLSRLYNSMAALACSRRALIEAYQFLAHRKTFGKIALEHSLIRTKFTELGALNVANFYLVWRAIRSLDLADAGNEREKELFRFINPLTKKWSAETGVYITRESMELMGGNGYIEDFVMPKLMRDVMVLPIWEGSGNIIILDMLRAMAKSKGFEILCEEITESAKSNSEFGSWLNAELMQLIAFSEKLNGLSQDEKEASAQLFFEKLTSLYQISLLIDNLNEESKQWILPSLKFLKEKYQSTDELKEVKPLSAEEVKQLIAWEF
ncbi:MAG: acyl-CoA dehydrogenase family protein [Bacteroidetes bacterium]|nr:acyl-CoA dehydrogenase family protein [Bacteroidota bacterium]